MRAVGIEVLKNKLSEYVRLAAAGESVLVTIATGLLRSSDRRPRKGRRA
jgi:antitoxin (DNA-binding transcriptional repressor) of toxin-antitoxin stability system